MNDGASLNIDYKTKTKLKPAALKTIMPVTLQGKQIIPKSDLKPKKAGKKTKKTGQGQQGNGSQVRSNSIASNSGRSKNGKKSLLSPKNIKMNKVGSPFHGKPVKSPGKRKNVGEHNYYF